jgi:diguanylate cyclase (GGDEF)-like protein
MAEVVSTTTILVALGAAVVTLVLVFVVLALRRRPDEDEGQAIELAWEMNRRLKKMVRELSEALEDAREEARRNRFLGELGSSIDLDEVLSHTAAAAGAMPDVDAALVCISAPGEAPIVATLGLSADEAQRQVISGPPDGHEARAISIVYRYPPTLEADGLVHSGLAVPVRREGRPGGFLTVFSRSPAQRFDEDAVRELEELARRAGPAIENARRFREVRELADLDALTNLHNRRFFHETLAREVSRAQRYGRQLTLVVFDLDNFKAINDRIGHLAGDAVLAEIAERVRDVVRAADVACRVGGDEFAVILPESSLDEADQLYHRLQHAVSSRPAARAGRLNLSAGIAELTVEDDATTFFGRADEALYRAKEHGKAQVVEAAAG